MTTLQLIFVIFTVISGIVSLVVWRKKEKQLKFIFKPLTTLLIIAIAFLNEPGSFFLYKNLIIAGLFFALLGDIFLMLPKNRFVAGLSAFAISVILLTFAFAIAPGPYFGWIYLIPSAVYAIIFLLVFLKRTGKMTIPVMAYVILLTLFLWQASGRAWYLAEDGVMLAFFGAIAFILSDSILAYNKFIKAFRLAPVFYMSLYWTALLLISFSI